MNIKFTKHNTKKEDVNCSIGTSNRPYIKIGDDHRLDIICLGNSVFGIGQEEYNFELSSSDGSFNASKSISKFNDIRSTILDLLLLLLGEEYTDEEINTALEDQGVYDYFEKYLDKRLP